MLPNSRFLAPVLAVALGLMLLGPPAILATTHPVPPGKPTVLSPSPRATLPTFAVGRPAFRSARPTGAALWTTAQGNISLQNSHYSISSIVFDGVNGRFYGLANLVTGLLIVNPQLLLVTWTPGAGNASILLAEPWVLALGLWDFFLVDPVNGDLLIQSSTNQSGQIPIVVVNATNETAYTAGSLDSPGAGSGLLIPIAYDSASNEIYLADQLANNSTMMFAISASTFQPRAAFPVNAPVDYGAFDPANQRLYLSTLFFDCPGCGGPNPNLTYAVFQNLTVVSTLTDSIVDTFANVSSGPGFFDPASAEVYIVGQNVTILDPATDTLSTVITPGAAGEGCLDGATHDLYSINSAGLLVISTESNQLIGRIPTSGAPQFLGLDPQTGTLYANEGYNLSVGGFEWLDMNVVNPNATWYAVQVHESGLPLGTSWSVSINGLLRRSTDPELTVYEPDGNYTYLLPTVPGWVARPAAGILEVSGGVMALNVTYQSATGGLVGRVLPATAAVDLGGERLNLTGDGNFSVMNLTAGVYMLRAVAPGYQPYVTNLSITDGNTTQVTIRLVSEAAGGVPWTTLTPLAGILLGAVTAVAAVAIAGMALYVRRRRPPNGPGAGGPPDPRTPNR